MDMADFLDTSLFADEPRSDPFVMPWPAPGNPAALLAFQSFPEWQAFVLARPLHPAIPQIVSDKFRRAQKLYVLAWIDFDLVKAGELVALTALELALKDRYGLLLHQQKKQGERRMFLPQLLDYLVEHDGLSDASFPFTRRYGGSVVPFLLGHKTKHRTLGSTARTSLAGIRNSLAHGDPFDGLPWSGLLELVRDLIEYAYRSYLLEADR